MFKTKNPNVETVREMVKTFHQSAISAEGEIERAIKDLMVPKDVLIDRQEKLDVPGSNRNVDRIYIPLDIPFTIYKSGFFRKGTWDRMEGIARNISSDFFVQGIRGMGYPKVWTKVCPELIKDGMLKYPMNYDFESMVARVSGDTYRNPNDYYNCSRDEHIRIDEYLWNNFVFPRVVQYCRQASFHAGDETLNILVQV